jgi:arginase
VKTILVPYHHAEPLPVLAQAYHGDDAVVVSKGPAGAMLARLYEQVATRVAASDEPVTVISGDCTTALATIAGLQRRGAVPGVIWIDAHADFHTARTTRSGDLSGMALAMATGRGGAALTAPLGLRAVPDEACVLAGVRDVEPGEREALEASAIRRLPLEELAAAPLPDGPWYVHLDLDVLDPATLPPLRFPVAGGPSLVMLGEALRTLARRGTIAALGVGCTLTSRALAEPDALEPVRRLVENAMGTPG